MGNYENEIFEFGSGSNEELEQTSNFDYDSISGLGESDYENEDLFSVEVDSNNFINDNFNNDFRIGDFNNIADVSNVDYYNEDKKAIEDSVLQQDSDDFKIPTFGEEYVEPYIDQNEKLEKEEQFNEEDINWNNQIEEEPLVIEDEFQPESIEITPQSSLNVDEQIEDDKKESISIQDKIEELMEKDGDIELVTLQSENNDESEFVESKEEVVDSSETKEEITISDTPIEEIQSLTEYEEDKIEETDINTLFDRVSINVKDASDIFRKNTDLKQKIDTRFEELKKLQSEIENSRKKQIDEINAYKDEVYSKLTEKKEEIEKRLNLLKESQATLEKEKKEFEQYKKEEKENIDRVQKEVQSAYDDRREELNHIEDVLRKQKDVLDEERSQLSLDKIQYEADKNELANNLLKFNELVNSFTNGVDGIKE